MNFKNILAFLVTLVMLVQISCKKKESTAAPVKVDPPIAFGDILNCHRMNPWDSSSIHTKLTGKWKWEYIKCYWNPEDANNEDFRGYEVEFKSDNTLQIKENGQLTQASTWHITDLNDGFFKIDVAAFTPLLRGRILFCDSLVLFYDSYIDGCDNYFKITN